MSASFRGHKTRLPVRLFLLRALVFSSVPFTTSAFLCQVAVAQEEPMKVLVGEFGGAKGSSARAWVVEGLTADLRFEPLGDTGGLKHGADESVIQAAAAQVEADAVVLGKGIFKNGWTCEISVYDGKDGSLIETKQVSAKNWEAYQAAVTGGAEYFGVIAGAVGFPPAAPEPEVSLEEEQEEEAAPAAPTEPVQKGKPSPLDVSVGVKIYGRSFRYTDSLEQLDPDAGYEPLTDYSLDAAPMPFIGGHWYPGAHVTDSFLAHLGISAGYEMGIATKVRYEQEDQIFKQTHQLWYAGVRGRIPVSVFTLGLGANYGGHAFALKDSADGSPNGVFPNVNYSFLELGGDVEVNIGKVILGGGGGYLLVLGVGEIGTDGWFPNAKAKGGHFFGNAGWAFSPILDALVGIDVRRYGLNFNPVDVGTPPDRVAGGAIDTYIAATFALRFKIPEKPSGGGAKADKGTEKGGGGFESFD